MSIVPRKNLDIPPRCEKYKKTLLIFSAKYGKIHYICGLNVSRTFSPACGGKNIGYSMKEVFIIKIKGVDIGEVLRSLKTKEGRRAFYEKHKAIILYFAFGIGTTLISLGSYYIIRKIFPDAESVPSWLSWIFKITAMFHIESKTVLPVLASWILANLFSFFTNRVYVFNSQAHSFGRFMFEMAKFFASRIATLIVDMVIMFLLVDLTGIHGGLYEFCAKIFSNIIVLILNFILSKVFVFRKKRSKKTPEAPETQSEE